MTPLSALIRAARTSAGLTQEALAARCRDAGHPTVLRESIARAERSAPRPGQAGRAGVSETLLAAICDALGLDVQLVAERVRTPSAEPCDEPMSPREPMSSAAKAGTKVQK